MITAISKQGIGIGQAEGQASSLIFSAVVIAGCVTAGYMIARKRKGTGALIGGIVGLASLFIIPAPSEWL